MVLRRNRAAGIPAADRPALERDLAPGSAPRRDRASRYHDDDPKFRRAGAQAVAIISRHCADTARSYLMHQS